MSEQSSCAQVRFEAIGSVEVVEVEVFCIDAATLRRQNRTTSLMSNVIGRSVTFREQRDMDLETPGTLTWWRDGWAFCKGRPVPTPGDPPQLPPGSRDHRSQ